MGGGSDERSPEDRDRGLGGMADVGTELSGFPADCEEDPNPVQRKHRERE
jgi:hypothetical protein